jgi:predicted nucleic acid-binding Zn ribbon protein
MTCVAIDRRLCSDSAGLVNGNERRWRNFRERVVAVTANTGQDAWT